DVPAVRAGAGPRGPPPHLRPAGLRAGRRPPGPLQGLPPGRPRPLRSVPGGDHKRPPRPLTPVDRVVGEPGGAFWPRVVPDDKAPEARPSYHAPWAHASR